MKVGRFRHGRVTKQPALAVSRSSSALAQTTTSGSSTNALPSDVEAPPSAWELADPAETDIAMLERARVYWQFGDWLSLAAIGQINLESNPDRASIALLVASAHQQLNDDDQVLRFIGQARSWGASPTQLKRTLLGGLNNMLARAALLIGEPAKAASYFEKSIAIASPHTAHALAARARADCQARQLGATANRLSPPAFAEPVSKFGEHREDVDASAWNHPARLADLPAPFELDSELLIAVASLKARGEYNAKAVLSQVATHIQQLTGDSKVLEVNLTPLQVDDSDFIFLHVAGDYIPSKIEREQQFYEHEFLKLLSFLVLPDGLIIDVGANIGNHTLYFSGVLQNQVISIEPEMHNAAFLALNVHLNGVEDRVRILRCAAGASVGAITLQMAIPDNFGSFSSADLSSKSNTPKFADRMPTVIETIRLDDLMPWMRLDMQVSLIKIDVEGMESDVLRGALELIEKHKPLITVECFSNNQLEQIEAFLTGFGYFPVEVTNHTPTFVFVCVHNTFHMKRLQTHLRKAAIDKIPVDKGFF